MYLLKLATDGIYAKDLEYKDICLELIQHYIQNEILMKNINETLTNREGKRF
jgi:hypothetical protein